VNLLQSQLVATTLRSDRDSLVDLFLDKSIDEEIHRYPASIKANWD